MKTKSRVPQPQEFPRGRCGQLLRTNCWPFLPTTKRPCTNVASLHTEGSPTLRAFVLGYWRRDQCARWSGGGGGGTLTLSPISLRPQGIVSALETGFLQHSVAPGFCIHRFPPAAQHTVKSHTYPLSTEQAPACWPELSGHEAQSAHMGRSEANTPGAALCQEPEGWWERLPCSQMAIAQAP